LYRAHYQSRALEEALIKQSIPYTIVGGIEFYERKEIKDLLAYLRLMVNPFDRVSFSRVINCPQRGLGEKFEEEFYACWDMEPLFDFKLIAQDLLQRDALTRAKKTALVSFITVFDAVSATDLPSHALDRILSLTAYMAYVKNSYETQEAESRMDNIKELLHAVRYLEEQGISSITQFLDDVALMQDKLSTEEKGENPVLLMTLHAAKGLEFDQVVITGLEEGILPSSRALTENNVEEERRLLYVGITRAKERLLMTHCRYRYTYGQMNTQHESRFVQEMSPDLLACHDGSSRSIVEMQRIFTQWLGITSVPSATSSSVLTFGTAKKAFSEEPAQPKISTVTIWKKNQPVQHKKFGTGIIQMVEKKDDGSIYLTIDFRVGTKKIDAKFVTQV
jgi:DNA helicase-2/ATP-dependent DNA helicase PcrA